MPAIPLHNLESLIALWPYALVGLVAAIGGAALKDGKLRLPRIRVEREADGSSTTYLDPGFVATGLTGGLLAGIMDQSLHNAAMWGIATAFLGKEIFQPLLTALGRAGGSQVTFQHGPVVAATQPVPAPAKDQR